MLNVVATVVLAILVAILGQKRFGEDRVEKDLLIEATRRATDSVRESLGTLKLGYESDKPDLEATNAGLDAIGIALTDLRSLLSDAEFNRAYSEADSVYHELFTGYRRLASGGKFPAPYEVEVYLAAKHQAEEMIRQLRKLVFTINRR